VAVAADDPSILVWLRSCFDPLVKHKFKKGLEPFINTSGQKKAVLKPWGNLTIGFSGGLGSTVLLNLVRRCYYSPEEVDEKKGNNPRNDAIWKKVTVCYVEVSEVYPEVRRYGALRVYGCELKVERSRCRIGPRRWRGLSGSRIPPSSSSLSASRTLLTDGGGRRFAVGLWQSQISRCGSIQVGAEDCATFLVLISTPVDLAFKLLDNTSLTPLESLRTYFRSLPTQTAVHSSIQTLIRVLLLHVAQSTSSSHVLLGTSLTSLAISLISGISQGGGYNVREEAQEDWTPPSTSAGGKEKAIRLVRPLRDVGVKECATYAWWRELRVLGKEKWPGGRQSISGLTKGSGEGRRHVCVSFAHRQCLRVYHGIGEGLPFYRVDDHTDLRQVGVEG